MVFVEENLRHERYHESIVLPANHFANVLTNKTTRHRKIQSLQPNKPKQPHPVNMGVLKILTHLMGCMLFSAGGTQ